MDRYHVCTECGVMDEEMEAPCDECGNDFIVGMSIEALGNIADTLGPI